MSVVTTGRGDQVDGRREGQWTPRGARPAGPAGPPAGERLPAPPRERRPALAALAVLLVVGGAATAGLLAVRADDRVPVLVASRDIPAGQEITRADLATVSVAPGDVDLLPADVAGQVVGRFSAGRIPQGRLLDAQMLTTDGLYAPGQAAVGVKLLPGRAPAQGLQPGDVVQVVRVVDGTGEEVVPRATVAHVAEPGSEGGGLSTSATGDPVATLVVSPADATAVAAASAADQLAFVLVERAG
ncbi:SAF domain-containing protein [Thalassiella azotivora]